MTIEDDLKRHKMMAEALRPYLTTDWQLFEINIEAKLDENGEVVVDGLSLIAGPVPEV